MRLFTGMEAKFHGLSKHMDVNILVNNLGKVQVQTTIHGGKVTNLI